MIDKLDDYDDDDDDYDDDDETDLTVDPKIMVNDAVTDGDLVVSVIGSDFCPEIYTHREKLKTIITGLIEGKEYVIFLVTRDSDLGRLVSDIISEITHLQPFRLLYLISVLPYPTDEYKEHVKEYDSYYSYTITVLEHYQPDCRYIRDRYMTDHCNILLCHFSRSSEERFKVIPYADVKNKRVLFL